MTLQTYSTILAIGAIAILAFSLLITFDKKERINISTFFSLVIAAISGGSIVGALIYEYIYGTAPCEMCWWGRIALFPIFPISLLALRYKITNVNKIIMLLAGIGLLIAVYHYYYHFNIYVLDNALSMPCDANPLTPSCSSNNDILVFGFITMPFMGILNFLSMILLANKIKD